MRRRPASVLRCRSRARPSCSRRDRWRSRTPRSRVWTSACACHSDSPRSRRPAVSAATPSSRPSIKAAHGLPWPTDQRQADACQDCHPDHRGPRLPAHRLAGRRKAFDHARTGWRLEGAHARTDVRGVPPSAPVPRRRSSGCCAAQPATTYLGLSTRCAAATSTSTGGSSAPTASAATTTAKWKPAPGFDHEPDRFALRGKHIAVALRQVPPTARRRGPRASSVGPPSRGARVHADEADRPPDVRELPCGSARGQARARPAATATPRTGWRGSGRQSDSRSVVPRPDPVPAARWPHRRPLPELPRPVPGTAGALQGPGLLPAAATVTKTPTSASSRRRPKRPSADCERCHTVDGFSPPRFEVEQHAKTRFPLDGGHAVTACRGCHALDDRLAARVPSASGACCAEQHRPLEVSLAVLRPPERPDACAGCHADPHAGQFAAEVRGTTAAAVTPRIVSPPEVRPRAPEPVSAGGRARRARLRLPATAPSTTAPGSRRRPLQAAAGHVRRLPRRRAPGPVRPARPDASRATATTATLPPRDDLQGDQVLARGPRGSPPSPCGGSTPVAVRDCHRASRGRRAASRPSGTAAAPACADCHVDFHHGDFRGLEP